MRLIRKLTIVLALFLCVNVTKAAYGDVVLDTISDYMGWGWDALSVTNHYISLVIIPEIGGRVISYGFYFDEYMAINEGQMGSNYDPNTNNYGPWSSWGYGGYKCWPAPQTGWDSDPGSDWPPPPHLDWGVYSYVVEYASADSVIIYLESEVETNSSSSFNTAKGLQQARRFRIYKKSTKVAIEQILKNVSSTSNSWSIWEVTQALPDHNNSNDYSNISLYFPAKSSDVKILSGGGVTTSSVNDSIRKYNHNSTNNKIGVLNKPGWSCYVDERDFQSYAKVFDVDANKTHTDQNTNFQIYSGGDYDEIEVLSPIYTIVQGDSASYTEYWYASQTKGAMQNINHAGAIYDKLNIDVLSKNITGTYGIFTTGKLKLTFSNNETTLGSIDTFNVVASSQFVFDLNSEIPEGTIKADVIAYNSDNQLIDTLDTWITENPISGINDISTSDALEIYPNVVESGSLINIQLSNSSYTSYLLTLIDIRGQIIEKVNVKPDEISNLLNYSLPVISPGIYIINIRSGNYFANSMIIAN